MRSISEVFLPRFGGEGEGEGRVCLTGVTEGEGIMGDIEVTVGEMGPSRRFGGDFEAGTMVAVEDCMDSNACILALTAEEAMDAVTGRADLEEE